MTKPIALLFAIFVLFSIIFCLFLRVSYLESRQKAYALIPQNTLQTSQGNLEKVNAKDYTQGNSQAEITLIEYSDFECPSCQRMHPIFQKIIKMYGKDIRFVQRMFPLPQNKNAEKEAEAVLCAGKIGGENLYWKYGDEIFKRTNGTEGGEGFTLNALTPLSKELGLDDKAFSSCLNIKKMVQEVDREKQSGEAAGVSQLPALFIVDKQNKTMLITGEQSLQTLQVILSYAMQE